MFRGVTKKEKKSTRSSFALRWWSSMSTFLGWIHHTLFLKTKIVCFPRTDSRSLWICHHHYYYFNFSIFDTSTMSPSAGLTWLCRRFQPCLCCCGDVEMLIHLDRDWNSSFWKKYKFLNYLLSLQLNIMCHDCIIKFGAFLSFSFLFFLPTLILIPNMMWCKLQWCGMAGLYCLSKGL